MPSLKLCLPYKAGFSALLPRLSTMNNARSYHSFYHVEPPIADPSTIENKILGKAYKEFVPQEGFTELAVKKGAEAVGIANNVYDSLYKQLTNSNSSLPKAQQTFKAWRVAYLPERWADK